MSSRSVPATTRLMWGAMLALVMSLRLLTPAGFMPSFDGGRVVVIPCDGFTPPPAHMAHHSKPSHEPCSYAAGSAPASLQDEALVPAEPLTFPPAVGQRADAAQVELAPRLRPPSTGPPISA